MNLLRPLGITTFLLIALCNLNARDVEVRNVSFTQMDELIFITYDLMGELNKKYTIEVSLSDDYGTSFGIKPQIVQGDVGKDITPGSDKQIIWEMTADYPNGLDGEGFVFAVDATLQKSGGSNTLYYLLGAGVVGGVVYFVTQGSGGGSEGEEEHGSISITIPGEM